MSEAEQTPLEFTSIPYGSYVQINTFPCSPSSEVFQSGEAPSSSLSRKPVKYVMNNQSFLCRKLPSGEVCILTEEEIDRVQKTDQCGHIDRHSLDESAEYLEVTPEEVLKDNFMARDKIKELEQKLTESTIRDALGDDPKGINIVPSQLNRSGSTSSQLNRSGSTSSGYSEGMSFSPLSTIKEGQMSENLSDEDLRRTVESLRTEVKEKEESIEILKSICESCCSNEQELKSTLNKACETVQSLDTQLEGEAFEKFKVQSEFDKHKTMTSSLLEDLKASKDKIAQKEKEKEKLKCSYESELVRTTREKANTEVQLHRSKTDSQLLQGELARAEGRARVFETKWREAAAEAKGYRRKLDENYAKVLQLEPENGQLKERVKELESILQAMQNQ